LSASKKSWKKKVSCTARSDADGDRPSIKKAEGLVYPQNRKMVG